MTDAAEPNEKVGYKRPPRHSRFQPGVSGNPRGRQLQRNGERAPHLRA